MVPIDRLNLNSAEGAWANRGKMLFTTVGIAPRPAPVSFITKEADPNLDVLGDVVITGGAGFLGRYLAKSLATSGLRVTVLDDLSCSNSTFDCPELQHERIRCVKGSVFNRRLVNKLVAEHKTVVHLASVVGVEETISHSKRTVENLKGTLNVVGALSPEHVTLFTSSADVYGAHSHFYDRAMREDDYFLFQSAKVNRWVYPHVKALEENLITNSIARSVVIRVFNTYGPAMDFPAPKRVIPHFIDRVLSRQPLRLERRRLAASKLLLYGRYDSRHGSCPSVRRIPKHSFQPVLQPWLALSNYNARTSQ